MLLKKKKTQVRTGLVRFQWASALFTPRLSASGEEGSERYSVQIIIDKKDTTTVKEIQEAWKNAYNEGVTSKWAGKKMECKLNLKDGDKDTNSEGDLYSEKYPELKGSYFMTVGSKTKVPLFYKLPSSTEPLEAGEGDIYSGCYGSVVISFGAYPKKGTIKAGVACYLNSVCKLKDGDSLGVATANASTFDDLAGE